MNKALSSNLYLEQAALDELSPERMNRIQESADYSREDFETRVASLKKENSDFHVRVPASQMLASIRERAFRGELDASRIAGAVMDFPPAGLGRRLGSHAADSSGDSGKSGRSGTAPSLSATRFTRRWVPIALAAALPLVLVLGIMLRVNSGLLPGDSRVSDGDVIRTKGLEPRIFVYRDGGENGAELLQNNSLARENDRLQISYLATGKNYGSIVSVDGSGVLTLHYPENSRILPRLQPFDEVYLPYAYRLDDAPQFERFYFITSEDAFDVQDLLASISAQIRSSAWRVSGNLELPDSFSVFRFDVAKPSR